MPGNSGSVGPSHNHVQPGGGDNPSVTVPGLDREIKPGDTLTDDEAQKIADASGGQLTFENGVLQGKNPDGSGDVYIEVGKPLDAGQIHDLHHTVPGSGGEGNNGGGHH